MNKSTYFIGTELEFNWIISELDNLKIPYNFKKNTDSSFPVLEQMNGFAEITIPEEYKVQVDAILDNYEGMSETSEEVPEEKMSAAFGFAGKTNKSRKLLIILIIYSLVVTFLLIRYWNIVRQVSEQKNFVYEFSLDGTSISTIDKKSAKRITMSIDRNYDLNSEEIRMYSKEGFLTSISFDRNENGYYEEIETYSKDGKISSLSFDRNEDGFYEENHFVNDKGQVTGKSYDSNNDGKIELSNLVLQNGDTLKLIDDDKDGFFRSN